MRIRTFTASLLIALSLLASQAAYTTTVIQQPSNAGTVQALTKLFDGLVRTWAYYAFEVDTKIASFLKAHSALLTSASETANKSKMMSDTDIKHTLTDYVAYQNVFLGKQKAVDSSTFFNNAAQKTDVQKYLAHLKTTNMRALLLPPRASVQTDDEKIRVKEDVKDSASFISRTFDQLYCLSRSRKALCKSAGSLCAYEAIHLCNKNNWEGIKLPSDADAIYEKILAQRKNCAAGNEPTGTNPCYDSTERGKILMRQKLLQTILQPAIPTTVNENELGYKAYHAYKTGDRKYDANSLLAPLAFSNKQHTSKPDSRMTYEDKVKAAQDFIHYVSEYAKLPPMRDPSLEIPHFLTKKQKKNMNESARVALQSKTDPSAVDHFKTIRKAQKKRANMIRQLIVLKNIVITNFYHLYLERLMKDAIINLNLRDEQNNPITSELQLKVFMARKELTEAGIAQTAKNSPSLVARKQLRLLAAINSQLVQNQLMQERILATLSVVALAGLKKDIGEVTQLKQTITSDLNVVLNGGMSVPSPDNPSAGVSKESINTQVEKNK